MELSESPVALACDIGLSHLDTIDRGQLKAGSRSQVSPTPPSVNPSLSSRPSREGTTVLDTEQQESNPIQDPTTHVGEPKTLTNSSSVLNSIARQIRMIDPVVTPTTRQLTRMSLNFPSAAIADSIFGRMRVLNTVGLGLIRTLNSSAVVQAIQNINSSPWVAQVTEMSAQFQTTINLICRELSSSFRPLRELAERIGEASSVRDAFLHYNLWLAPSMSEELVGKIVRSYEAGTGSGTVHSMVSRYYAKDNWCRLEEVLERCRNNSLFASRMKPIEEALQGHREGLYNLTVPGLLIHLEGIAADYVKKHKLLQKVDGKTRQIILAALNDAPYSLWDARTYAGVSALIGYIEESMFASVDFDKEHGRLHGENRLLGHAVRHGRQVAFGSRMNSLRMFLIIDVMAMLEN